MGGAENITKLISANLDSKIFFVTVASLYKATRQSWPKKIDIIYLNKKPGIDISILFKLVKLFKKYKPDIIHNHHIHSLPYIAIANLFSRAQIVQTIHSDIRYLNSPSIWKSILIIFKVEVVNLSPRINQSLQKLKRNTNIPNGIEIEKFLQRTNSLTKKIINIGRFDDNKNQQYLLDIFKEIIKKNPEFFLTLAGVGKNESLIRKKARLLKLEENVKIINKKIDPAKYFKKSSYYLSTSIYEGMPLTILEAMAGGLVVFATKAGSIEDILRDKINGFIIPHSNPEKAAEIFLSKIENEPGLLKTSQMAVLRANQFSYKSMVKKYAKLFKKIYYKKN